MGWCYTCTYVSVMPCLNSITIIALIVTLAIALTQNRYSIIPRVLVLWSRVAVAWKPKFNIALERNAVVIKVQLSDY